MSHSTPLRHADRVLSAAQLRAHGVSHAQATARCRPGGPWQSLLPGVYLLHSGPVTEQERLRGVLLYAGRPVVPAQGRGAGADPEDGATLRGPYGDAMITGLAALALHGFTGVEPAHRRERIDVLVPGTRRLRSVGCARIVRAHALPRARTIDGLPVAPVARALADAVAETTDPDTVRRLLTEAVRDGHCEPATVVSALNRARLLDRPSVVDAVDALLAEGRSLAEERLYALVYGQGLPDPVWNVDLRLPGGAYLGGVDAYWPDQALAVELDTRAPRHDEETVWAEGTRRRERLERLGITVVHITPRKLREAPEQQATVVRAALAAGRDRDPAPAVVVLPR
ncbi:hypothetical protein [Streptomyces sp. NPDC020965]|uniref:hypothetical protein n=1 Tax=Streptomyces sp. NPDC020965 TaxID=3365105 RepID=UPI00379C25B7